jgi:WD40 repeat protein
VRNRSRLQPRTRKDSATQVGADVEAWQDETARYDMISRRSTLQALVFFSVCVAPRAWAQGAPPIEWAGAGHTDVYGVAISPDGTLVATASLTDDTIKLWNASDGRFLRTLAGSFGGISAVAFTPDSQHLASAGAMPFGSPVSDALLWRVSDGAIEMQFHAPSTELHSVAVSPDGALVAAGDQNSNAWVWRTSDGQLVLTLAGHTASVHSIAFSPDALLIATGSDDHTVKLWQASDGSIVDTLTGHAGVVSSVAFCPTGRYLASGSWDQTVDVWNVNNGHLLLALAGHTGLVASVAWSPSGRSLASGSWDDTVSVTKIPDGNLQHVLTAPSVEPVNSVAYMPTGNSLWAGGLDGKTRRWSVSQQSVLTTLGHHRSGILGVAISNDSILCASASRDTDLRVWDLASGTELEKLSGNADVVNACAFSPDASVLASAAGSPPPFTLDPSVCLWRVSDGARLWIAPGHVDGTTCVAMSADAKTVYSGGYDFDVRWWRASDGSLDKVLAGHTDTVTSLAVSPDGLLLASASADKTIKVWRTSNGAYVRTISGSPAPILSIAFSPDGATIAALEDSFGQNVQLFDVASGTLVSTFAGDASGYVDSVAFSPSGNTLVTTSGYARAIRFWRVSDGVLLGMYDKETGWGPDPVLPLALSPDGLHIVYGRGDATLVSATNPFP